MPSSVVFMTNGVYVLNSEGVEPNFTLFTGEEFIEKTEPYVRTDFVGFQDTTEATIEGYITGMSQGNYIS
jgi:5-formaminoimidazole-4-carboxamide-1-beta-D-ribofuranosyl 5'-monophosphate synthetase